MDSELLRLRKLASIAQIGWWEADFSAGHYVCSEYLADLLNVDGNTITFEDFRSLIREDYRDSTVKGFSESIHKEFYEATFPVKTKYGDKWVNSRLGAREEIPGRGVVSFGIIQLVENDAMRLYADPHREDELVRRQNSIARSLLHFVNEQDLNVCINAVLQDILDFYKGGRAYIFEFDETYTYQKCTYEVVADGVAAEIDNLLLPVEMIPWWNGRILAGKPMILDSLDQLPPEASSEYEILNQQDIKSIMIVPLQSGDRVWGYIGVDLVKEFRSWLDEDYQWFSSLANIIAICIDLRKSKDKVIQEHSFLQNLFLHMPLGYFKISMIRDQDDNIVDFVVDDANMASAQIAGHIPNHYQGVKKPASEIYDDYALRLDGLLEVVNTDGYREKEYLFEKTGRTARCLFYSPDKDVVVVLLLDSTEMLKANDARGRSEKLLQNVFDNIPVGVEIYDKNGLLIDMNQRDMEIFSVARKEDVVGVDFFQNPNVSEEVKEEVRTKDTAEFSVTYSFETATKYYSPKRISGGIELFTKVSKIYDNQGNFNGYILINIDNTEKLHAAIRISDFENLFLLISNYAHVGYCKFNCATNQGFAVPQWYKNLGEDDGAPLSEVVGVYQNVHPDDRREFLRNFHAMMEGKISDFQDEMRVKSPDNKNKWNWISVNIVLRKYEPEHNIIEIVGINYDITQLKDTEAMLIKAKDKAEMMDRLKSAFIANMSHEIRTPLNAIVGFSGLLAETHDQEDRAQYLKIIRDNNDLLLRLITDVLNMSKIESGALELTVEKVNLTTLFDEVAKTIRPKLAPGVNLVMRPDSNVSIMESDRYRLMQVLQNLVGNAVKFTAKGEITVGYELHDDVVEFSVSDTGVGIPADQFSNIFERFVKLNNFIPGTGLGLSISKNIIEELGGEISVTSVLGKGSQFRFTLPYNPCAADQAQKKTVSGVK